VSEGSSRLSGHPSRRRQRRLCGALAAAWVGLLVGGLFLDGCTKVEDAKNLAGTGSATELAPEIVQRVKDAVVLIEVRLRTAAGLLEATGSGFFISTDGYLITNAHVVSLNATTPDGTSVRATERTLRVVLHSGTPAERTIAVKVVREHPVKDLALLKIDAKPPAILELGDSDTATETTRIFVCGHPLGLREISIRSGTVTAHRTWDNRPFIEHDALAEGGNSGGPVINAEGKVVGVHVQSLGARGEALTKLAIPSNVVREWLASDPKDDPQETP